jgi:hypothetical protein
MGAETAEDPRGKGTEDRIGRGTAGMNAEKKRYRLHKKHGPGGRRDVPSTTLLVLSLLCVQEQCP